MSGIPVSEWVAIAAALAAGGALTGFFSGLLGIGGGGILVPIIYEILRLLDVDLAVRMHVAVATSLAVIAPTAVSSFRSHKARGVVDLGVYRRMRPWVFVGVVCGVLLASSVGGETLKVFFVMFCGALAIKLFAGGDRFQFGTVLPGGLADVGVAMFTGFVATLIGNGGGAYVSGYMTLYGRSIHQAVATAAGFGPIIAIPAIIGYAIAGWSEPGLPPGSLGYVSVLGAAVIMPTAIVMAPVGVRVAHGMSRRRLEIAFALFLTAAGIRFAASLIANASG